jgi:hypothetical protein
MGRTGFIWLRIGSSGRLLWTRWWTFGFHKESWIFFDKLSDYSTPWSNGVKIKSHFWGAQLVTTIKYLRNSKWR